MTQTQFPPHPSNRETPDSLGAAPVEPHTADSHAAERRVLLDLFGPPDERRFGVRFWDGEADPPPVPDAPFTIVVSRPGALRRMLLPPTELSIIEAYLFGDMDVEGNLEAATDLGDVIARRLGSAKAMRRLVRDAIALPTGERSASGGARSASLRDLWRLGRRHTDRRDAHAVRFHYDVGNDFYALWLDPAMVYSCAYFPTGAETLETAQQAKLDLICRKLRLRAGERLLDIGCGWGALIMHAATHYGVEAIGITLSEQQAALATKRIAEAGLDSRCRVEVRDYRALTGAGMFDKIASIGMVEHVGAGRLPGYFGAAFSVLRPGGLFLNHGIVGIAAARPSSVRDRLLARLWRRNAFIHRYVFPDGDLVPAATMVAAAEREGFETRDVESLREHYVVTLRHWVRRLEQHRPEAVASVGEQTYRVWRLYMAASAYGFRSGRIGIIQMLLAKQDVDGRAGLPSTREDLYPGPARR